MILEKLIISLAKKTSLWEKEAYLYSFTKQSITDHFAKMKMSFIDSNGTRYFSYISMDDCPLQRYEMLQITLMEIDNRINYHDLDLFADKMLEIVNNEKSKTKISDLSIMVLALKKRRELLYDPELMFRMAAIMYIREDQDPTIWDEDLEKIKISQFKIDAAGGLHDFFYSCGLGNYLSGLTQSKSVLMQHQEMENQLDQMKEFQNLLATLQIS